MLAPDPADMRYVDLNYEPMTAEDLKAKAQSTNPEDAFLAVAKRMPVRIRVLMDSRKISSLLVACANAKLTFEVHQLRFNPPVHAPMGFGGFGGTGYGGTGYGATGTLGAASTETPSSGYPPSGSSGYPPSGSSGYPPSGYASSPSGYGSSSRSTYGSGYSGYGGGYDDPYGEQPAETYDRPVELFGIVYIFNPVDRSKLGSEPGGTDPATATGDEVASTTRVGRGL
jgi:hypothetical protein